MKKSELRNIIRNIISEQNTTSCKAIFAESCGESPVNYYVPCALMGPSIEEWQASGEALDNLPGSTPQVGDTFHLLSVFGGPKDYKVTGIQEPTAGIVRVMPAAVNPEACSESSTSGNTNYMPGGVGNVTGPTGPTATLSTKDMDLSKPPQAGGSSADMTAKKSRMKKLANIKPPRKR